MTGPEPADQGDPKPRSRRGLASMSPERRREIAAMGGRAAAAQGKGHRFTPEEARDAGRKGGATTSRDRDHMSEIGARGARSGKKRGAAPPEGRN